MSLEVGVENFSEDLLGAPRRRPVVVGEVKMGDTEVERFQDEFATVSEIVDATEIVPKPERERGEFQSAASALAVERWLIVTGRGGSVRHVENEVVGKIWAMQGPVKGRHGR